MEFLELAKTTLAIIGFAALVYAGYRVSKSKFLGGEHGPIRVKGGSVHVSNDVDWVLDDDDAVREYHAKGGSNRWKVDIWKNEADASGPPVATYYGRRVIVHVDDGSGGAADYQIRFLANGAARVVDAQDKLTHSGNQLSNLSAGHRLTKVVVKTRFNPVQDYSFGPGEKGYVELRPQF
jgi:hypothetical protein